MHDRLHIGLSKQIDPHSGLTSTTKCRISRTPEFPIQPSNPLRKIDYRKAPQFVEIIDAVFSRGATTLTKDAGLDFISDVLEAKSAIEIGIMRALIAQNLA
jgi:hypothetical protein